MREFRTSGSEGGRVREGPVYPTFLACAGALGEICLQARRPLGGLG